MAGAAGRALSGIDAMMWRTGRAEPGMRWVITAVLLLAAAPSRERFRRRWAAAAGVAPQLQARPAFGVVGLAPRLIRDPDFDVDRHLEFRSIRSSTGHGDPPADPWQEVLDIARGMSLGDFPDDRPWWRAALVTGLPGGRSAVVVAMHHAIADGRAAVGMAMGLFDGHPDADPPEPAPRGPAGTPNRVLTSAADALDLARRLWGIGRKAGSMAAELARQPRDSPDRWGEQLRSLQRTRANRESMLSPLLTGRGETYRFATRQLRFAELRLAASLRNASVNDVFVGGLCAGMARYHERHGTSAQRLRFAVAISMRDRVPEREGLANRGNAVTLATLELPVNSASNAQRVLAVRTRVSRWRAEPALHVGQRLVELHWLVPVSRLLEGARGHDIGASNLPGPPAPVFLAGQRVLGIWPLVSPVGAAVNVTMITYAGQAFLGIAADERAVPDLDVLADDLAEGLHGIGRD